MPEDKKPPTIPEIVRALTTIDDRHRQALREREDVHMRALRKKELSVQGLERVLERRDWEVTVLREVIAQLCERIERTQVQLRRDNQQCVYSEPLDIMNLLGRETDASKIVVAAKDKKRADEMKQARKAAEESDPTEGDPNVCQYACTHPTRAHGPFGCTRSGCRCKAPNKAPCGTQFDAGPCAGTWLHRGDCAPAADDISTQEDKAVECDCGVTWKDGVMGPGHGDMQCYAMEKPCRVCGHPEDRHTRSLPEEGNKPYCTECAWADEKHEFDGTPALPTDKCNCGCIRKEHTDGQCSQCPGDSERSWRHQFMLKTTG